MNCLVTPMIICRDFVRAGREGDWSLHLQTVKEILLYFFASGHTNFARYGLYYLLSMQSLAATSITQAVLR